MSVFKSKLLEADKCTQELNKGEYLNEKASKYSMERRVPFSALHLTLYGFIHEFPFLYP